MSSVEEPKKCPYMWMPDEVYWGFKRAMRDKNPEAYLKVQNLMVQCAKGVHEGHDHSGVDTDGKTVRWNSEDFG